MKKQSIIWIISCIILVLSESCSANKLNRQKERSIIAYSGQPNIILITISSLRADHLSCAGYNRQTTPNFDRFAKGNILFTNAFATSSWQMPAVGSIFTSLYPTDHGATHIDNKFNSKIKTLAGTLKRNGFYTAGFTCDPRLSSINGFDKGFEYYDDYSVQMIISSISFDRDENFDINKKRTNDLINNAAERWLQNNIHKPFFLFLNYYDNHWDYLPPAPYNTLFNPDYVGDIKGTEIAREPLYSNKPSDKDVEQIIALYDGQVKQTDYDLGEFLGFLKGQGRFKDSVIIVMGDHGEQFYEHGHTSHHGIFDELISIPFAISLPDSNEPKVISSLVSSVDIMPTILNYVNIAIPSQCKGQSLKPLIEGKTSNIRDFVFVEYTGGAVEDCYAVRFEKYKFIYEKDDIFAYDLKSDPCEQKKIFKDDFTTEMIEMYEKVKHLLVKEHLAN